MSKRFVVVGGATVVAGLVLGASIVLGPDAITNNNSGVSSNIGAAGVGNGAGQEGISGAIATKFDITNIEVGDNGEIRRVRIRADRFSYKDQKITDLTRPRADIYLGTQRSISITADQADLQMDKEQPRAGTFSGNVVITLFEAPAGTELITEPDDPKHARFIQQRIYLDEKTFFSIEEDSIKTEGPVHATSQQVDFYGIGLNLAYNTQQKRIQRLDIAEGRYLLYNPQANAPGFSARQAQNDSATPDSGQEEAPNTETTDNAAPAQFYAASFFDNVVIREGLESELAGDTLTIDFSMGSEAVAEPGANTTITPATSALPRYLISSGSRLVQADNNPALPLIEVPQKNASRSLFKHDAERDVVVTWTGMMKVSPYEIKPEALADEKDVRVNLAGENAYAQTTRNGELERLETSRLEYLRSQERTTAFAKTSGPARILSEVLGGSITGQRITLRQHEGSATVLGPGLLTYTNKDDGKTLTLHWKNRLDLELYTEPRAEGGEDGSNSRTRILGVKTATFDGGVTANHPDFDLAANKLTLAFSKPDNASNSGNDPTAINAVGDVSVFAKGDAEDERFTINAQRLSIDLKLDTDGQTYASAIRAIESVDVRRPDSILTCDRVGVELIPPSETKKDAKQDETDDRFAQVRTITAVGDVRAKLDYDDRRVDLVADTLLAEVDRDRLTLSSNNTRELAEVFDIGKQQKITGQLIVMDDQAEALDITGPGALATRLADPNEPEAGLEDAFLAINWSRSMKFNNITGKAEFYDNVRSESRRSTDASELLCDQLIMQFSLEEEKNADKKKDREVRTAVATGNVKFTASAWDPLESDKVRNRTLLEGPKLVFTNTPAQVLGQPPVETLFVDGKGHMLIEDYRPPDEGDQDNSVFVTGRGATLFTWEKSMLLDAQTNTATLTKTVQMVHQPKDDDGKVSDVVTLNGEVLVADLIDTGGLSVWLSDDAPDAQISVITVDGGVRLKNTGRAMAGDHLKYVAKNDQVTVWTDPGKDVLLQDLKRGNDTRTNKVMWDLGKDRIEIDELRGGAAPLD